MAISPLAYRALLARQVQHFLRGGVAQSEGPMGPDAPGGGVYNAPNGNVVSATPGQSPYAEPNPLGGNFNITGSNAWNNTPYQSGFSAQVPLSMQTFNPGQYQGSVNSSQANLNTLAGMLMQQANGGGPNLAAQQERQATDRNIAQQFALAQASGANNPAAAKQLADTTANLNQQAAADSATQRMQQQLAAQQQLQALSLGQLGTAGSLMTDQQKMALSQAQGNQQAALAAQGQNLQQTLANQQLAEANLQGAVQVGGDALKAGGQAVATLAQGTGNAVSNADGSGDWGNSPDIAARDAAAQNAISNIGGDSGGDSGGVSPPTDMSGGMAHGGLVHPLARMYAAGGAVEDPNQAGTLQAYDYAAPSQVADARLAAAPALTATAGAVGPVSATKLLSLGAFSAPKQDSSVGQKIGSAVGDVLSYMPIIGPVVSAGRALGNDVNSWTGSPVRYSAHGGVIPPAQQLAHLWAQGGPIPGTPAVPHNSYRNDVVPAVLSPGEDVMPLSVMLARNPAEAAKKFIQHQMDTGEVHPLVKHLACGGMAQHFDEGGGVLGNTSPLTGRPLSASTPAPTPATQQPGTLGDTNSPLTGTPLAPASAGMGDVKLAEAQAQPAAPQGAPSQPAPSPVTQAVLGAAPAEAQPQKPQGMGAPDYSGTYGKATKDAAQALEAQAAIEAKKADVQAAAAQHKADLLTQVQAEDLAKKNAYDAAYNAQLSRLQDAMAQYGTTNTTVDANRYWDSRTTGQKILSSIGVFLGGLGGGQNEALASIHQAIRNDLDAQRETIQNNLAKGKEAISNQGTLLGLMRSKFEDDAQARAAAEAVALNQAAAQTEAQVQRLNNPASIANGKLLAAQLRQAAAGKQQEFSNQAQELALRKSIQQTEEAKVGMEMLKLQAAAKPNAANAPVDLVNDLEAKFNAANKGVGMAVAAHLPGGVAPKTNTYLDSREASKMLLAKALSGSNRQANPEAIALAEKLLPTSTTSQAEAKHRFNAIRTVLASVASGGAGQPDTSGLEGDLQAEE